MTSSIPSRVRLIDVGPRDGLQNEKTPVPAAVKVELVHRLQQAGLQEIEVTSYVSPKWVPQMADNHEVMSGIARQPGVAYSVLTPNLKGFEAAVIDKPDEIVVFGAASEAFSQRNINCSIAESIERFAPVVQAALAAGIRVRGYVSCVLGCPYEGEVPMAKVVEVSAALAAMGCYEISLGDTIGVGTPRKARAMLEAVASAVPMPRLAVHFHDTWGQALANVAACIEAGVRVADSAVAGTGGCPYARGASGNVASEDLVYMLHGMGIDTGIDLDALAATGRWLAGKLGRQTGSKVGRALAPA